MQLSYHMTRTSRDRETLPPAAPDADARAFEAAMRERGEVAARWAQLMALLAPEQERRAS